MPQVTFFGDPMETETTHTYSPDDAMTLLQLARANAVPMDWYCSQGTCGHCAVRVTVLGKGIPVMGNRERNVLAREGKPTDLVEGAANWRLACQYVLSGADLRVDW